jgi:transposase
MNELNKIVLKAFEKDQHQHHKGVVELLHYLKKNGETKWLEIQKKRWSCNNCGHPFSWHNKNCENCNEKVDGLEK